MLDGESMNGLLYNPVCPPDDASLYKHTFETIPRKRVFGIVMRSARAEAAGGAAA